MLYFLLITLSVVDAMYQYSLEWYINLFTKAIADSAQADLDKALPALAKAVRPVLAPDASIVGLDSRAEYVSGTNVCDGDTSFNGATCSVRCQAGYTTADQDYICGEDGLWVPGSIANPGTPLSCAGR